MYLRILFIKLIIIVIFIIRYITICNNKIRYILLCHLKKSYFVVLKIECKMIIANLFPKKIILFPKRLYCVFLFAKYFLVFKYYYYYFKEHNT